MERLDDERVLTHWTFSIISPDRFDWRAEVSHDGGNIWLLEQQMHALRHFIGEVAH